MRCYHIDVLWSFTQRIYDLKINKTATLESERAIERERGERERTSSISLNLVFFSSDLEARRYTDELTRLNGSLGYFEF